MIPWDYAALYPFPYGVRASKDLEDSRGMCLPADRRGLEAGRSSSLHSRRDAANHLRAAVQASPGVERPGRAGDALTDDLRGAVDEDRHDSARG